MTRRGFIGKSLAAIGAVGVASRLFPFDRRLPELLSPRSVEAVGSVSAASKVLAQGARLQDFYPKLVVDLRTTRSEEEIKEVFDSYYDDAKDRIRTLFASDPETLIERWHYHHSTGSRDEVEP